MFKKPKNTYNVYESSNVRKLNFFLIEYISQFLVFYLM